MLNEADILKQLEQFEVPEKCPIIVHSSLKAIGYIEGGAEALLNALRKHFCKNDGLLCVPTHTWDEQFMDLTSPRSNIGALPNTALVTPEGIRSLHPTHSMVVFGDRAEEFVKNEPFVDSPTNPEGCYGNLAAMFF